MYTRLFNGILKMELKSYIFSHTQEMHDVCVRGLHSFEASVNFYFHLKIIISNVVFSFFTEIAL